MTNPFEETRALSSILAKPRRSRWPWRSAVTVVSVVALSAIAAGAGGYLGRQNAPHSLVKQVREIVPDVPRLDSAADQYTLAMFRQNDADAFRAVREFHEQDTKPDDPQRNTTELYFHRADQQLATIYLEQGDYDAAEPILRRLYAVGDSEPEFLSVAAYGLARVEAARNNVTGSDHYLIEAFFYRESLPVDLRNQVEAAVASGRRL